MFFLSFGFPLLNGRNVAAAVLSIKYYVIKSEVKK